MAVRISCCSFPSDIAMASKGAVLPLLRRELHTNRTRLNRAASSFSTVATTVRNTRAVSTRHSARHTALFSRRQLLGQTRAFSQSLSTRLTDEEGHFDPRQVERESDEVDVCIVGGGKSFRVLQLFVATHRLVADSTLHRRRSCRSCGSYPTKATCKRRWKRGIPCNCAGKSGRAGRTYTFRQCSPTNRNE